MVDGHKENGKFHPHNSKPGIHSGSVNHSTYSHPGSVKSGKSLHQEDFKIGDMVIAGGELGKITHIKNDYDTQKAERYYVNGKYWNPGSVIEVSKGNHYPNEFSTEDFDDYFESKNILMYVDDDKDKMEGGGHLQHVEEDPVKRKAWVTDYAKRHNAQIYTLVDLDSGDVGYSKGIRFVNRIDQGNYVVVRKSDLVVDNS